MIEESNRVNLSEPPLIDGSRVTLSLIGDLVDRYPDWRLTSHTTPAGREVLMIEYADEDGEFTEFLPGEFVKLVSEAGGEE